MGGVRRALKGFAYRKSLQPLWFGIAAFLLLLCHIVFDARRLFTVRFHNSKITINVAQYGLGNGESLSKDTYILLNQVKNGEKPIFVIEDDMLRKAKEALPIRNFRKWNILNDSFSTDAKLWDNAAAGKYPYMHRYRTFADLPPFSEAECRDDLGKRIPNIVHFIWFGKLRMTFPQYLSVRSAATIQKPLFIILHTDGGEPTGKYWKSLRTEVTCLDVRYLPRPSKLFGKFQLRSLQEQSHIARIKLMYEEGGIYSNFNVIFLKPFDNLMDHSLVLGKEEEQYYGNSVILAEKGAPFLLTWFNAYNRRIVDWSTYSMHIPWRIHQGNPNARIHAEEFSMMRPNFQEDDWIIKRNWMLDDNYCVHLYTSRARIRALTQSPPLDAISMDNTFGQLTRMALFGKLYLNEKVEQFRNAVHGSLQCSSPDENAKDAVPNSVNFLLEDEIFTYKHYLSVRSAIRAIRPSAVNIHIFGKSPDNFYWIRLQREISCLKVTHSPQKEVHTANSSKAEIKNKYIINYLYRNGGIFLSHNVFVTKPFKQLMRNQVVIGANAAYNGHIDVLLAREEAEFLPLWLSWQKNDISIIGRIQTYVKEHPENSIKILDQFPAISSAFGWKTTDFEQGYPQCFLVTERDNRVNLDDIEYDILRENSLSGNIARMAIFGTDEVFTSYGSIH